MRAQDNVSNFQWAIEAVLKSHGLYLAFMANPAFSIRLVQPTFMRLEIRRRERERLTIASVLNIDGKGYYVPRVDFFMGYFAKGPWQSIGIQQNNFFIDYRLTSDSPYAPIRAVHGMEKILNTCEYGNRPFFHPSIGRVLGQWATELQAHWIAHETTEPEAVPQKHIYPLIMA